MGLKSLMTIKPLSIPPIIKSTLSNVISAKPSIPLPITIPKPTAKTALMALTVVNPLAGAAVLAYENKDEIKSTLTNAADKVESAAVAVKQDTIKAVDTVGSGVKTVATSAVNGIENIYFYGMLGIGAIILLRFM